MTEFLRVDGATPYPVERTRMEALQLHESVHLEAWIKAHPEVLGDDLMVVTTQFNRWESDSATARERPDVLALSSNGQLAVVELKRGGDRRVHLQAITYAAMASAFTLERLAEAHAHWIQSETGESIDKDEAARRLTAHVDEWREDLLAVPRIVIVAEEYPPQVLTTVQWLDGVAPSLAIECHEYSLFRSDGATYVAFNRLFPLENLEDRLLRPATAAVGGSSRAVQNETQRRARSASIIHANNLIPVGASITLELAGRVRPDVAQHVDDWLEQNPAWRDVRWTNDPVRPLVCAGADEPTRPWTPSALRNEIFARAGAPAPSFSAADAWTYAGRDLHSIAGDATLTDD